MAILCFYVCLLKTDGQEVLCETFNSFTGGQPSTRRMIRRQNILYAKNVYFFPTDFSRNRIKFHDRFHKRIFLHIIQAYMYIMLYCVNEYNNRTFKQKGTLNTKQLIFSWRIHFALVKAELNSTARCSVALKRVALEQKFSDSITVINIALWSYSTTVYVMFILYKYTT